MDGESSSVSTLFTASKSFVAIGASNGLNDFLVNSQQLLILIHDARLGGCDSFME